MEDNLKKCPKCGSEIANVATECPICNYNFLQSVNNNAANNNIANNVNAPNKKHWCLVTILVIKI